jgi:hypothetical protein
MDCDGGIAELPEIAENERLPADNSRSVVAGLTLICTFAVADPLALSETLTVKE